MPSLPHPELLVLGYRRWGNGLAGHLVGDFAFVLWDERERSIYAARDPFGCGRCITTQMAAAWFSQPKSLKCLL